MDYLDRLHKAIAKEKIHEQYIYGKLSTEQMEQKVRKVGSKLKKKKS